MRDKLEYNMYKRKKQPSNRQYCVQFLVIVFV